MRSKLTLLLIACWVSLMMPAMSTAEEAAGCPLGIEKGEIWIKTNLKYNDMKERYNRGTDEMADLGKGEHNRVYASGIRLGYGITYRWDVGVLLSYKWVDKKIYDKKAKAWTEIEDDGLPSQAPPAADIRQMPDDPSEPYSRNYGGPNPASIKHKATGATASKPSPAQPAVPADLPPAFRRQLAMAGYVTE